MYGDDTTVYCVGKNFDQVCIQFNKIFEQLRLWSLKNRLCIHPIKSGVMVLSRTNFIGPILPIYFGSNFVNVVNHATCLGLVIDNRLTWTMHINHIRKSCIKEVGTLSRMKKLPTCRSVLEGIYFRSIIPGVTYSIMVWGNCSSAKLIWIL